MSDAVRVEDRDRVRHITLNRPEKINALDAAMMLAIAIALSGVDVQRHDAIVLSGEGERGFCAGADIAEFSQGVDSLARQEHALVAMIEAFALCQVPIAVMAHGRALGAGGTLLTLADLAIVADDLSFGFPEIRFGMYPAIVHASLMYKLSAAQAAQLCLSGRSLDAAQAMDLGLVTRIVPRADWTQARREQWNFFAERRPALAIAKRAWLHDGAGDRLGRRVRALAPLMIENFQHPDVQAKIARALGGSRG